MSRFLLVLLVTVAVAGCAQPEVAPSPTPDEELGSAPTVAPVEPSPVVSPTPGEAANPVAGAAPTPSAEPSAAAAPATEPSTQASTPASSGAGDEATATTVDEPRVLLAVADAAGDHGSQGPAWTDLRALELVEVGEDLRVTLRFEGSLPQPPPAGEVPLLGVDIGAEGYQLFVEGGGESWAAYLDTPEGFVPYPGTFELAGRAMVLQVPFNAVGSPTRAPVRAFVEWSRDSGLVGALNPTSEDRLDGEPHRFDRAP